MPAAPASPRAPSARGRHRRRLLVEAASAVVLEGGFAAVSHRAVAQRADLPLAATTYYFASLDQLRAEALEHLVAGWTAAARDLVERLPQQLPDVRPLAEALVEVCALAPVGAGAGQPGGDPGSLATLYDRYLEAARHPSLRAAVARFDEEVDALLAEVLRRGGLPASADDARLVLAVVDGALLRCLAEGAHPSTATAVVEHLLRALAAR